MNIDEFVRMEKGVCRHQAVVTAYIFNGLTKEISIKTGKPYLTGEVQIMHDNVKGGAHAWVTLVNDHEKQHIDPMWNFMGEFLTKEGVKAIEKKYGFDATVNQLLKTENI